MAIAQYDRNRRRGGRILAAVGQQVVRRTIQRGFNSFKKMFSKSKENPQKAVTSQHDMQVQKFKTRKTNRGAGKRTRKFRAKVMNALTAYSNPSWIRFYDSNYTKTAASNTQNMFIIGSLYGLGGTSGGSDNRDMEQIMFTVQPKGAEHTAAGATAYIHAIDDNKLRIQSAYLESNVANTDAQTLILDTYECICRKTMTNYTRIEDIITSMPSNKWNGTNPTSTFSSDTLGVTPFQSPPWTAGFKILNKTRYRIPGGDSVSIKMYGHRTRTISGEMIVNSTAPCLRGWTKVLVGVIRGETSLNGTQAVTARWDSLRMYNVDPNSSVYPITGSTVAT